MKIIRSKDNSIYKDAYRLLKKKYRDATGLYLLEGVKPLEDAVRQDINIERIFISEKSVSGVAEKSDILKSVDDGKLIVLSESLFKKLSETETSQGVIAVAAKREYEMDEFVKRFMHSGRNLIVLDGLQDPGNIGTIIRTAEAAGYEAVVLTPGCADVYSPKVVRAAAGSLFRIPIVHGISCGHTASLLKKCGKRVVVTDIETDIYYDEVDLSSDTAIVIGNEGRGVSDEMKKASDIKIKIPMQGSIESLNAAVAAGILMYRSYKTN